MRIRNTAALMLAGVALLVGGCSADREASVLEEVPDTSVAVTAIDMPQLLNEAGCSRPFSADGAMEEDAERLLSMLVLPDFREAYAAALRGSEYADLSHTVSFTTSRGRDMIVFPLRDQQRFAEATGALGKKETGSGFDVVEIGGAVLAMKDGRCRIAHDLATVEEAIVQARMNHIARFDGLRLFLESEGAVKTAVSCGGSMISFLGGRDKWLCVDFKVNDAAVSAEATVISGDGTPDAIGAQFGVIDTDFLRYTPDDAAVVLAFGDFSGNPRALSFLLGRFAPVYLEEADGTTSLWAAPAGGVQSVATHEPGAWNVQTMVHVSQQVLQEGLEEYSAGAGGAARKEGDQWMYRLGEESYWYGAFDGCLVFATNRSISGDYNNSFTDYFEGKRGAFLMRVPAGSVLSKAWGLPCGLTLRVSLETDKLKARINFSGAEGSALHTLLNLPQTGDYAERFRLNTGI